MPSDCQKTQYSSANSLDLIFRVAEPLQFQLMLVKAVGAQWFLMTHLGDTCVWALRN